MRSFQPGDPQALRRPSDRRERTAIIKARLLARRLRGLPPDEIERLTRIFVCAFLAELLDNGHLDLPTVLSMANIPMELVIARRLAEEVAPRPVHQPAP